jgi:hypothetical protein
MEINEGIQIIGGNPNIQIGNLAVGRNAKAIQETQTPKQSEEVRERTSPTEASHKKVFVCYSHKDEQWLERLQVHLKPLERRGLIKLWSDAEIAVGTQWKDEIDTAIQSCAIALLLVSADFLASDFIEKYELPTLLSRAKHEGTTIMPIIVAPCLFEESKINMFQAINSPNNPLSGMKPSTQEKTLVKLAKAIIQRLT